MPRGTGNFNIAPVGLGALRSRAIGVGVPHQLLKVRQRRPEFPDPHYGDIGAVQAYRRELFAGVQRLQVLVPHGHAVQVQHTKALDPLDMFQPLPGDR